jgi:hypothetical protein
LQETVNAARRELLAALQWQVRKEIEQLEENLATWDSVRALPSLDPDAAPRQQKGATKRTVPSGYLSGVGQGRGYLDAARANPGRGYLAVRGAARPAGIPAGRGYLARRPESASATRPAPVAPPASMLPPLPDSSVSAMVLSKDILHALEAAEREK